MSSATLEVPSGDAAALDLMPASDDAPFLVAARGGVPSRRPIWIMRQAGRYLPEYRDVRSRLSFLELCADADSAAEVTLQPLRRFDLDAAILFTDLLTPVPPMGLELDYAPGPILKNTVKTRADVDALRIPVPEDDLAPMLATARKVRAALPQSKALLGFVGAPFTMACYLIEGHGTKSWNETRRLMYAEPDFFEALMTRIAECLRPLVRALIANGCDAIQVFDSWASVLDARSYARFAAPGTRVLLEEAQASGALAINYVNGAFAHLDSMCASPAEVLAVDWRHELRDYRAATGPERCLQGNLDPTALFAGRAELEARVHAICEGAGRGAHVFNLGHGVLPQTDPASVEFVIDTVRRFDAREAGA